MQLMPKIWDVGFVVLVNVVLMISVSVRQVLWCWRSPENFLRIVSRPVSSHRRLS